MLLRVLQYMLNNKGWGVVVFKQSPKAAAVEMLN